MLENVEKKVEAICFFSDRDERRTKISVLAEALSKMSHLRFLIIKNVIFLGHLSALSNELRYVEWKKYPCKYLPSSFQPNQLVELILKQSSVKQLWKDKKHLPNLRILDLRNLSSLSNELRYVEWDRYPFKYLPSSFEPYQLVELILKHSSIEHLWKDKKYLLSLRTLDLSSKKACFLEFERL
ncbi:disease resistance protein RUN1 [Trifolium repens]|nr:disease resistance protein RUN1 [Trifolium repens]